MKVYYLFEKFIKMELFLINISRVIFNKINSMPPVDEPFIKFMESGVS
jgi:hypothetical protein